jgi:uncharacterized protein (DUF4415 family)
LAETVSSVLAERIKQRRAVTPAKVNVRYVKFTPEEMAYDVPDDTSHFVPVGRGPGAVFAKPPKKQTVIRLDPDVAKVFKDAGSVNRALRKLLEAIPAPPTRRRKTA